MTGLPFEQWENDPAFQGLPIEQKTKAYSNYFDRNMADDEFRSLPPDRQQGIKQNFLSQTIKPSMPTPAPIRSPMPMSPVQQKIGAMETLANLATNIPASLLGGLTYLGALPRQSDRKISPAESMQAVQGGLTYAPKTEAGKKMTEAVGWPFKKLAEAAPVVGEKVLDMTGSPLLATAAHTGVEGLPWLLPIAPKALKGIVQEIRNSTTFRQLTIPQKGVVIQDLQHVLNNPQNVKEGMTEAELVKRYGKGSKYWEQALQRRMNGETSSVFEDILEPKTGTIEQTLPEFMGKGTERPLPAKVPPIEPTELKRAPEEPKPMIGPASPIPLLQAPGPAPQPPTKPIPGPVGGSSAFFPEGAPIQVPPPIQLQGPTGPLPIARKPEEPAPAPLISPTVEEQPKVEANAQAPAEEQESIAGMAFRTTSGRIISGKDFGIQGKTHADIWERMTPEQQKQVKEDNGVITTNGRFLTHDEAVDLVSNKTPREEKKKLWDANELWGRPVEAKAPVEAGKAKEPWEMTKDEWLDQPAREMPPGVGGKRREEIAIQRHAKAVEKAISEGKPVPPEVLKDYPELQPKEVIPNGEERKGQEGQREALLEKEPAPAEGEGQAKQPWEMTLAEYRKSPRLDANHPAPGHPWGTSEESITKSAQRHRLAVEIAIDEGKPVSKKVLRAYPDLIKKSAQAPAEAVAAPKEAKPQTATEKRATALRKLTDLRESKPHSIDKVFGKNGPTPEQRKDHIDKVKEWEKQYRAANKSFKEYDEAEKVEIKETAKGPVVKADLPKEAEGEEKPGVLSKLNKKLGEEGAFSWQKKPKEGEGLLDTISSLQRPGQPRSIVSISELRDKANMPQDKFDKALFDLSREGKVALHKHDSPFSLPEAERNKLLVEDQPGAYHEGKNYYVGVVPKTAILPIKTRQERIRREQVK